MEILNNWSSRPSTRTLSDQRTLQATQIAKRKCSIRNSIVNTSYIFNHQHNHNALYQQLLLEGCQIQVEKVSDMVFL